MNIQRINQNIIILPPPYTRTAYPIIYRWTAISKLCEHIIYYIIRKSNTISFFSQEKFCLLSTEECDAPTNSAHKSFTIQMYIIWSVYNIAVKSKNKRHSSNSIKYSLQDKQYYAQMSVDHIQMPFEWIPFNLILRRNFIFKCIQTITIWNIILVL